MSGRASTRDEGTVLPIVLVLSIVLALVVVGLAKYASGTLRFGQVVENSADRLATANGALDNALEDIQRNSSRCTLFNQDYDLSDTINGITARITCDWTGGDRNLVDAFAVIITGAGTGRSGPLLEITNGGLSPEARKIFEGPVYMAAPPSDQAPSPTLDFQATLTLRNGDLWYSSGTCPSADVSLPGQLVIEPSGYTVKCLEDDWSTLFASRRPPEPTVTNTVAFPSRSDNPPSRDADGCYVWEPGRYEDEPDLVNQSYNYFRSGDYYFDDVGEWDIDNAFVLFGWPGATGPSIDGPDPQDTFANNPCRDQWTESDQTGASIYLGGDSSIRVDQGSTLEVSGRDHGGYVVGIQALETSGVASTVRGDANIVTTAAGGNKQLSVQGVVWAPFASFRFSLIANDAVAALTGGAVVGELHAGASAHANNFVIRVDTQPAVSVLQLTATATNTGTTAVRATTTVRSTGSVTNYAVTSRRVLNLTAE